jgi:two-component system, cell cycle sensor histidine kinase and response regulator CckA
MSKPRNSRTARRIDSQKGFPQPAQLFRVVAETATDAIVTIDEQSTILFVNTAAERIFGYAISEMMHQPVTMLMPHYLHEAHRASVGGYLQTGQKHFSRTAIKLTGLHRSGREFPIEVSLGEHVRGKRRIFTGIVRDISEREQSEALLRQSQEKYASMVHSSPDAITLRSLPDRRYLEVNEGFIRLTGYSAEEVLGKTPGELDLWVEQEPHQQTLQMVETHGQVKGNEFRFRTKTGEIRYGQVSAVRVAINGQPCMLSVTHDVTDRKLAEAQLQKSEAHFRSLILDAPYGIYRVTLDGQLLHVNPALVTILGYDSEEELMRRNMEKDIYRDPQLRQRLVRDNSHIDFRAVEVEWRRKDGKIITVKITGHPVLEKDNSLAYFEVFAEDITERRTLERQLLQSQKMEAIGRLAGGIAHDFNNLLSVILGHSDILEQQAGTDGRFRKSVEATRNAAERAAALTMQLLAFSRKQAIEPTIIDLNQSVAEIQKMLHRIIGEDIELAIRLQPGLGHVKADSGQLGQVLMNLAVNSRDAMPNGGKLAIETANVELDDTYVRQHLGARPGPFVMLAVSDTGIGMDIETLSHIFEPFFTTKEPGKGTGLGLSMVYGIIKQNNGYVMAYSEPGRGTTFKIYFPRTVESLPAPRGVEKETPGGSETILVVEDELALRELTCLLLQEAGYTVLESTGIEDAIAKAKDSQRKVDLLLTDIVMPRLDGRELANQLVALRPNLKVLYMSGYTDDVIDHRGLLKQTTVLVQKPFTKAKLLRKVRETLDSQLTNSLEPI